MKTLINGLESVFSENGKPRLTEYTIGNEGVSSSDSGVFIIPVAYGTIEACVICSDSEKLDVKVPVEIYDTEFRDASDQDNSDEALVDILDRLKKKEIP